MCRGNKHCRCHSSADSGRRKAEEVTAKRSGSVLGPEEGIQGVIGPAGGRRTATGGHTRITKNGLQQKSAVGFS